MEKLIKISLSSISKIEIYENPNHLSVRQIVDQNHPDLAITGLFYTSKWKPTCHLKKDGRVLASDTDIYRGCAWNHGKDIISCRVPTESKGKSNHYACCTLIANGAPYPNDLINYNKDVGGKRGRTGFGVSGNNFIVYASVDGKDAKTPEGLRDYLWSKDNGIDWFIMGDGGGKVNFYYNGDFIEGKEKSQNLILVYLDNKETKPEIEQSNKDMNIKQSYITSNPRYYSPQYRTKTGYMQHSTGTPGVMAKDFIKIWNKRSCEAEADFVIDDTGIYQTLPIGLKTWHCGGSANNTHVGCEVCEPEQARLIDANWYNLSYGGKNNTKYAVTALQKELDARGYDVNGIDGIFGKGLKKAVVQFQKDHKLTADGIVGKGTLHELQKRVGSYMLYNSQANQDYFENVYKKAVYTCAYILNEIHCKNVNKTTVLSHAEGYKAGVASNHADVGHWWVYHDKSMNDFRKDVEHYMATGELPFEKKEAKPEPIKPEPNEMEIAWAKATSMGLVDGTNPTGNVTRRQLVVVLDRLNLLD